MATSTRISPDAAGSSGSGGNDNKASEAEEKPLQSSETAKIDSSKLKMMHKEGSAKDLVGLLLHRGETGLLMYKKSRINETLLKSDTMGIARKKEKMPFAIIHPNKIYR